MLVEILETIALFTPWIITVRFIHICHTNTPTEEEN